VVLAIQIYLSTTYQNGKNIPNGKNGVKYNNRTRNIPTLSGPTPSKIYPYWDFWYEKIPSGNPGTV
jgi:hypothetical protein